MNESVMPTDRLKFVISVGVCFSAMKSRMSGWSIRRMPIFAIRAAPGPALFDDVCREVEEAHEGNRPGGHATRRRDPVVVRAHVTKRESCAAARLVDVGLMFQAVIDGGQGIFDRKDETGGELLEASPRIHQCGRIGKKIETGHAIVPASGRVGQSVGSGIESFSLRDVGCDAPE